MSDYDIIIIGAGIAGGSLAAFLPDNLNIALCEMEDMPGRHSTGRSAAFWSESYGGPLVEPLTSASGQFLMTPPKDFNEEGFLSNRGALHIGTKLDDGQRQKFLTAYEMSNFAYELVNKAQIETKISGLRGEWDIGIWEPNCRDINVAALHHSFLRQARKKQIDIKCNAELLKAIWKNGQWHVDIKGAHFTAKILVNAAGAWADNVAQNCGINPLSIRPYRRTMIELEVERQDDMPTPLILGLDGSFYFKDSGKNHIWLSPHDETASPPCDVSADEMDVAIAIDRFQKVVNWPIKKMVTKWAGLRSFAPDRLPIIGADKGNDHFFWLAGQGGFGIQTSPAIAALAARKLSEFIFGENRVDRMAQNIPIIDNIQYSPARF
ncbi:hypothetical protein LPB140_09560 [Sphingorhabdus lutea]|uniref:FAD dependent oxidoreductase domain-containing protein n=1 Tax=Sphingorhabdus lutea TaxID=1913578 RepID=A0A1L3JCY8_9SPHN|nr:FAD-dependent oxidoreductase [Sphingorhabdus lutea]APG62994.1 hypothetical protein LPB140_09560 [Sphingorhabdus lutea]